MRQDRHGNPLPHRMHVKGRAYYHVAGNRWTALGSDYTRALTAWATLEGGSVHADTLAEVWQAYSLDTTDGLLRLSEQGQRAYRRCWGALGPALGHFRLAEVRPEHVRTYRDRRSARSACRAELGFLGRLYRYARLRGWWGSLESPADSVRRPDCPPRQVTATDGQFAALLVAAKPMWRSVLTVAYCTGWRSTEIRLLRRSQVLPEGLQSAPQKGGQPAVVRWSDVLRQAVDAATAMQQVASVYVFCKRNGQPYSYGGWDAEWRRIRERAGIVGLTFHDLRRTAATAAHDLDHARMLLGHSDPALTGRVYRVTQYVDPVR
jgi:integrase